jgi:hypothetical protein
VHRIKLLVVKDSTKVIYKHDDVLSFNVLELRERPGSFYGKEAGAVHPKLLWETVRID